MINKKLVISAVIALALTACGGGAGGGVVPSSGGGSSGGGAPSSPADTMVTANPDIFDLQDSGLLAILESDVGETASTATRAASASPTQKIAATNNYSFETQVTGGYATVGRPGNTTSPGIGFIATTRDSTGSCECSNDTTVAPNKPYPSTVTNPSWAGSPYATYASTTSLGIAYRSDGSGGDHGGAYTFNVNKLPSGDTNSCIASCQFTIAGSGATQLPLQMAPTVTANDNGTTTISWTPAAGTKEFYVAFIAHHENQVSQPAVIVGFVVTDKTSVTISDKSLYSGAPYQALVVSADQDFIGVYLSQGATQLPALPSYIDFSLSQVTQFTAQ